MKIAGNRSDKKPHSLLPLMGFVIAITVGIIAYFAAPEVIKLLASAGIKGWTKIQFYQKLGITELAITNSTAHFAFAGLIWFFLFSVMMAIVAAAVGTTVGEEDVHLLYPKEGDVKGMKEYTKQIEKHQKRQKERALEYTRRMEKEAKKKK